MLKETEEITALDRIFSGKIDFIFGANEPGLLPKEELAEIAFVGKSNVGKSSLINYLTNRTSLARVSHTPGRTKQINFFTVGDRFSIVDLPGYGYAKVSKAEHANWEKLILGYLSKRKTLKLVMLLVDSRRGMKENDLQVLKLLQDLSLHYWIIYTKSDKISVGEQEALLKSAQSLELNEFCHIIFVHNRNKDGIKILKNRFWKYINSRFFEL